MAAPYPHRRVIRLFPDYCRDWPLWENSTPERETNYTMTPEDYGLSAELTAALAEWYAVWESRSGEGWDSDAHLEQWRRDGAALAEWLRREVADFADVSYEA